MITANSLTTQIVLQIMRQLLEDSDTMKYHQDLTIDSYRGGRKGSSRRSETDRQQIKCKMPPGCTRIVARDSLFLLA